MDTTSKISFVIPAYNCESTLAEAVASIFNTNFSEGDEVIIVNDGSVDKTEEVILSLQKKYPSVVYIKNEINKGCPASRNVGIRAAKNPLIFNLDSDNVLASKSIPPLKEYLLREKADIAAFGDTQYFPKSTKKITHKWVYEKTTLTLADLLAGPYNPGPGGNFLYTKASWQKIGGYWEYGKGLHEAWGFSLKQLANGAKFVVLPQLYYFHRYGYDSLDVVGRREENGSGEMSTKMLMNFIDLISPEGVTYIKETPNWFLKLSQKPIHLASGERGYTGYAVQLKKKSAILEKIKSNPLIRKMYHLYKRS